MDFYEQKSKLIGIFTILTTSIGYGILVKRKYFMSGAKKITVEVPEELLTKAQVQTGQGVTETVRQGLKLLAQSSTYDSLLKLKGKGNFALSWKEIKEDR